MKIFKKFISSGVRSVSFLIMQWIPKVLKVIWLGERMGS